MNLEKEIFKKSVFLYDKLLDYGFNEIDKKYVFSKKILDGTFSVNVEIVDGEVRAQVYDLSFGEEYINYRVEDQIGEFAGKIREEFESVLFDIRDKCTSTNYFVTSQANRIANKIYEKYGDIPEFPWTKGPGGGIFRNPNNKKWYGIVMDINKSKLDNGDEEVEIINVKLDPREIKTLLNKKGFYKAYHMNKENWITILLDDSVSDDEVMRCISESHKFTESINEWLVPANPKYYDVVNCFNDTNTILWKQSSNINVGDIVYLYVAAPYSSIMFKCEVIENDIPYSYSDSNLSMSKVMKIRLIRTFDKYEYTFDKLKEYGVNAIRGPRSVPKKLSELINKER